MLYFIELLAYYYYLEVSWREIEREESEIFMFEVGPGSGWGRFVDLILAVSILVASQGIFLVVFAWYFSNLLDDAVAELDARLALALKATIESLPFGDIEPPNPLLAILAQHLGKSVEAGPNPIIETTVRDAKGRFGSGNE